MLSHGGTSVFCVVVTFGLKGGEMSGWPNVLHPLEMQPLLYQKCMNVT